MPNYRMLVVAEKESFIVRVLVEKAQSARISCEFAQSKVEEISKKLEGVSLITLYLADASYPSDEVIHYLIEKMEANGQQVILIGEQLDLEHFVGKIPEHLVYTTFSRPVDNAAYTREITNYFDKINSGEFKKSILVVDDDANYLAIVREWLKDTYKVFMVNSGLQAIKWLGKNTVDLILLDHEMPVTSGPQVLEMLRSDDETKNIPVMFLTGKSDKESVMKVVALKPEGYFLKSIQREELLEKLHEFFVMHK
ncbi:response regulator [Butyrivibrio fibrisolvens]|uniref:response regulator n=1 Tax=Butyrivibrio fibrisolvens TaxID=831 RepID=UPI0003B76920|nr:response regulator [Butyrivibrio fibrisolvens]